MLAFGPPPTEASVSASTLDRFLADIERRAFRFAEMSLGNRDDALDAVQDAMIKLTTYAARPPGEWTPLFWRILRSRIVDTQRRRLFRLRWLAPDVAGDDDASFDWADDAPDPARAHDNREAYARVHDALRALPTRQREAFTLRVLEELDVADTARAMGCSEGAVKTHLSRARGSLQHRLNDVR